MMQNVLKLFFAICILGVSSLQAQTVTGTITDATDGSTLPGVNVIIKGTSNGVSADFDGNYSIEAKEANAILVFSYMGYTTKEVAVNGKAIINVALEQSAESLNEVVVTALGIKKETKKLGFAVTEVKGAELVKTNTVNPVLALQGKSAGLSIGASDGGLFGNSKIQIRGVSSLGSNNNQPIFVIDGVILENEVSDASADWAGNSNDFGNILKNLNPDDYKSVSVLKGAAATALYGSRGLNGVIIIQSKDGVGTKGIGVSVKQTVGFETVYKQPGLQYEYGQGKMAGWVDYGEDNPNGGFYKYDTSQMYTDGDGNATLVNHPWSWMGTGPKFDGRPIIGYDGEMTTYSPVKDNMIDAYDTGYNSNTAISLKGGNEKGSFYLSDSYNKRTGTIPNSEFSRNSLMLAGSYQLAPWLKAKASISFANTTSKNPSNDISHMFLGDGWTNTYDTNKYKESKYWQAPHGGLPNSNYGDQYTNIPGQYVWYNYNMNESERKEQVVRPVFTLTANVTDWLTITAEGNKNVYNIKSETKNIGSGFANEGGFYKLAHNTNESTTGKLNAMFTKDFGDTFTTSLLIGGEMWSQEKSNTWVETDGGFITPGLFYLGNSKKTLRSGGDVGGTKEINSAYFMASVGYKDQLFLDITSRNDWSSALVYTDGSGTNSYFYPSVSTSWLVDKTFELPEWVSFGKLRASWAQVGSDTDPYALNRGYDTGKYEMDGGNFVYHNGINTTLVDRGIQPQRKNSFEVGADIRLFGNRLGLDVAYYDDTTENQIDVVPIEEVNGFNYLFTNVGTLTNSGIEITVTGKPIQTEDFQWSTTASYWTAKTKLKDLHDSYGDIKSLAGYTNYGNFRVGSVAINNGEYGVLMSDSAPKVWQSTDGDGNNIDDPRNGMKILNWRDSKRGASYTRSGEQQKVGKIAPDFEWSFNNEFTYKNFNLSILLDARYGGHIASYSNKYGTAYGWLNTSLQGRDAEHGGVQWTSNYADDAGHVYNDGVIPDGVFSEGQTITGPNGSVDVGGLTYQEAFDQGLVEPTHASYFNYFNNSWSGGVVNDDWFSEVKYIALRNISIGYNLPKLAADKIGAKNLYISLNGRNLGYLYNSLPNDLNPESFRGTSSSASYRERSFSPYTASYTMTIAVDF